MGVAREYWVNVYEADGSYLLSRYAFKDNADWELELERPGPYVTPVWRPLYRIHVKLKEGV